LAKNVDPRSDKVQPVTAGILSAVLQPFRFVLKERIGVGRIARIHSFSSVNKTQREHDERGRATGHFLVKPASSD
jgi:hypothetical protein